MAEVSEVVPARGSITQVRSALEAAGVFGRKANDIIAGAMADHDQFAPESEDVATQRADNYVKQLTKQGVTLGADGYITIQGELTRYFMTA